LEQNAELRILFRCYSGPIEYLKTAVAAESDKPKLISVPSFIREFQLNWPLHTHKQEKCSIEHSYRRLKTLL
jgi:hypothetical protein